MLLGAFENSEDENLSRSTSHGNAMMTMMMMVGTNLEQRGLSGKGGPVQKTAAQFVAQKQLFL